MLNEIIETHTVVNVDLIPGNVCEMTLNESGVLRVVENHGREVLTLSVGL
jgi:hypothetical protein